MRMCQELKYDLPLYFDGVLDPETLEAIDSHLPQCPLCRQKIDDFRSIRNLLGNRREVPAPAGLLDSIRAGIAAELRPSVPFYGFRLVEAPSRSLSEWLMPYAVGSMASVIFSIALLSFILGTPPRLGPVARNPAARTSETTFVALKEPTATEYANSRLAFAEESPSVNPSGALIALTKSLVRGNMTDDEVVVVADVFGNGLAEISEVVEPSRDRGAVEELQKALRSDPAYAPFVPAAVDRRSDTVRVVLKIQSVNVYTRAGTTSQ